MYHESPAVTIITVTYGDGSMNILRKAVDGQWTRIGIGYHGYNDAFPVDETYVRLLTECMLDDNITVTIAQKRG